MANINMHTCGSSKNEREEVFYILEYQISSTMAVY